VGKPGRPRATYAIGDVQGCYRTLRRLVRRLPFDPSRDRLWLAGDLVNRGPRSLDVLRWAREQQAKLGGRFRVVLGNHDLHLIGRFLDARPPKRSDTLDEVLEAADGPALVRWLRRRPLLHRESPRGAERVLVHAGLHPAWTTRQAETLARGLEALIRGPEAAKFLARPGDGAVAWTRRLSPDRRIRAALFAFTLLRTCTAAGRPRRDYSGPPDEAPRGCMPWFEVPGRRSRKATVVCGHWAALGLCIAPGLVALDSGCVWGRRLSAVRLEDHAVFQEPAADS
jgi:bis(5'-nucleosyl)-tetraphosphatase (symmetrical)